VGWAQEKGRSRRSGFDRGLWKLLSLLADLFSCKVPSPDSGRTVATKS